MKFSELFNVLPSGSVSPKKPINIGGLFLGTGSTISLNVNINGIHLQASWDKEVRTQEVDGVVVIDPSGLSGP